MMYNTRDEDRKWGWKKDSEDSRDHKYKLEKPRILPESVDLRRWCSPVENQLSLGSCTAQAVAGLVEFLEIKERWPYQDLSRLFIYWNARKMEGTEGEDSGAEIRDAIKSVVNIGVCKESVWKYDISKYAVKPSWYAYLRALNYRAIEYQKIYSLYDMKNCLAEGYPFVFGFTVYQNFMGADVRNNGILGMPGNNDRSIGGHAVVAVGYEEKKSLFLVRNSWGEGWGIGGYFWMHYEYVADKNLADDMWMIRKV